MKYATVPFSALVASNRMDAEFFLGVTQLPEIARAETRLRQAKDRLKDLKAQRRKDLARQRKLGIVVKEG